MAGNTALGNAARAKEDEFYTQLSDIEKELRHYRKHFNGKTVLCNCDDPFESKFFEFFVKKFNAWGLKKLIATCYAGSPIIGRQFELFEVEPDAPPGTPYKAVVTKVYDKTGDGYFDMDDVRALFLSGENQLTKLQGDGDFRSQECLDILDEADIVVTNPPFSKFREYVATLVKHDKQFLIIGSQNNISYKEIFPLIMSGKIWLGCNAGDMAFTVPDYFEPRETRYWQDESGQKWRSLGNICWFTNLDHKKRHEEIDLYKHYTPEEYPKYVNYDAINVREIASIPCDYDGLMGVPITFLSKYNPEQFEILGSSSELARSMKEIAEKGTYISSGGRFYTTMINDKDRARGLLYHREYERLVIRNRHPEKPRQKNEN